MSSGTTAVPIPPPAPVTNTRMSWSPVGDDIARHDGSTGMTPSVMTMMPAVTRWEPNARGRLEQAALELFAEQGFEGTTVEDIATRAGLTKRTFFRYFGDKREVLFAGGEEFQAMFVN